MEVPIEGLRETQAERELEALREVLRGWFVQKVREGTAARAE